MSSHLLRIGAVLLALSLIVGDAAIASATGDSGTASIAGRISLPEGASPGELWVGAYSDDGDRGTGADVEDDGTYVIRGLQGGDYKVFFFTDSVDAFSEWWRDKRYRASADLISVPVGGQITNIDAILAAAGRISGTVTFPAGFDTAVGYTRVRAYTSAMSWYEARVDEEGYYELRGLRPGTYRLAFESVGRDLITTFLGGAYHYADATPITLAEEEVRAGVDMTLTDGGSISGTVTYPVGWEDRVFPTRAQLYDRVRDRLFASAAISADGSFRFGLVPAGSYIVHVDPADDALYPGRSDGGLLFDPEVPFTLAADEDRTGVDIALAPSATIAGRVEFPAGLAIPAGASISVDNLPRATAPIAADGSFRIDGLFEGAYRLRIDSGTDAVSDRWYGEGPRGTEVVVTRGQQLAGLTVTMLPTASLGGVVRFGAGTTPAAGSATVRVFPHPGGLYASATAPVAEDGSWRVDGLDAGAYSVFIDSEGQGALDQWVGAVSRAKASSFEVAPGQMRLDVASELVKSGSIRGRITLAPGHEIYGSRLDVEAYAMIGDVPIRRTGSISADGSYVISDLPAADYTIVAGHGVGYLRTSWKQTADDVVAGTLDLTPGEDREGVDIRILTSSRLSLRVVTPIVEGWSVYTVLHPVGGTGPDVTASGGYFRDLLPGSYTLSVAVRGVEVWYGGTSEATATVLTIEEGQGVDLGVFEARGLEAGLHPPSIRGDVRQGHIIAASWDRAQWPSGTRFTYQWYADGQAISDATSKYLTVPANALHKRLTVRVTAALDGYLDTTRTSEATDPVGIPKVLLPHAYIEGEPAVGESLIAGPANHDTSATYTYQWFADGARLSGAGAELKLTAAHLGKRITATLTGARQGYESTTLTTAATAPVTPGRLTAAIPTVSGTATVGSTLVAKRGTWTSGTSISYRWYDDGSPIAGATSSSFTLTKAQKSSRITVVVTGRKTGYATAAKTSKSTVKVTLAGTPSITGTVKVGRTLAAKAGTWTTGMSFSYQWYANGSAIAKATARTFVIPVSLRGKRITVKVTGKRTGYATVARMSRATIGVP